MDMQNLKLTFKNEIQSFIDFRNINKRYKKETVLNFDSFCNTIENKQFFYSYDQMLKDIGISTGNFEDFEFKFALRNFYIDTVGFSFISHDWIDPLIKYLNGKRCLEIMAGSGALSYALNAGGISTYCTDDYSFRDGNDMVAKNWDALKWQDVEKLDAVEAIHKYGKDCDYLIVSWPYIHFDWSPIIQSIKKINSNINIIYIGEVGGCCGDEELFNACNVINDVDFNTAVFNYTPWDGLYDYITLLKLKKRVISPI